VSAGPWPKVNIVINNFNYAEFLPDSIESALSQTYPSCSVTVVDDGSTDESSEVLARFADRVVVVHAESL
jgi:glycosyltransferase involved in cell wall biosynthesis